MPPRQEPPPSNEFDPELLLKLRKVSLADDHLQTPHLLHDEAVKFFTKVRDRFGGQGLYIEFFDIFDKYLDGDITPVEVFTEMSELFKDRDDLISEFVRSLPTRSGPSEVRKEEKEEAASDPDINMDHAD